MKVLITGGTGLIGSELVNYLCKFSNLHLFVISRNVDTIPPEKNIKYLSHDLRQKIPEDFLPDDIEIVIHLAAIAHDSSKVSMEINCAITNNLINVFKNRDIKFIYFSSVSVYGEAKRNFPVKVGDFCRPYSSYGLGKLKDESSIMKNLEKYYILRLAPFIDKDKTDLLKRVYLPKTLIKYRSPYPREYSLLSAKTVNEKIEQLIFLPEAFNKIENLSDKLIYTENILLSQYKGREVLFGKILCDLIFIFVNTLSFLSPIYKINCLLTKMLKTNTYE